jgi:hypothetical protein
MGVVNQLNGKLQKSSVNALCGKVLSANCISRCAHYRYWTRILHDLNHPCAAIVSAGPAIEEARGPNGKYGSRGFD